MPKKVIVILAAVAVALAAGAVYFFVFRNAQGNENAPPKLYNYAIEDSFVTNVRDSSKLFKATVVLVANKDKLDELLEKNQYVVRDTVLFILRDLTEADIRSSDIQDLLRVKIPRAINGALQIDSIVSVYFSDFVMQ